MQKTVPWELVVLLISITPAKMQRCPTKAGMHPVGSGAAARWPPVGLRTAIPSRNQMEGAGLGKRCLPATAHGLLHSGGRNGGGRAGHGNARQRVDDGDGVAAAGGSRLVKLHARLLALEGRGDEGGRSGVEREARRNRLRLLGGRRLGRVAGERGALRRGHGDELEGLVRE